MQFNLIYQAHSFLSLVFLMLSFSQCYTIAIHIHKYLTAISFSNYRISVQLYKKWKLKHQHNFICLVCYLL
jgi:hypothetical protein